MKLNLGFTVIARCTHIENDGTVKPKMDFELDLNMEQAQSFLMRFGPDSLELDNDIKVLFYRGHVENSPSGIIICAHDDGNYIVDNYNQLMRDIHEGYMKLYALDKFSTILEFDFEEGLSFQQEQDDTETE